MNVEQKHVQTTERVKGEESKFCIQSDAETKHFSFWLACNSFRLGDFRCHGYSQDQGTTQEVSEQSWLMV